MSGSRTPLPAADAAWLHMDRPANLMVITSVLWFDEQLPVAPLRELLQTRLVERFPRFRQRIVDGVAGPVFEDDPAFDLDLHLHHLALPAPGDRRALQTAVDDLIAQPLDHSRPLWDFHIFDNYRGGGALVARMHHCIADGIALARVLLSLTDAAGEADDDIAPPPTVRRHGRLHRLTGPIAGVAETGALGARAVAYEGLHVLAHPGSAVDMARTARQDAGTLAKLLLSPPDGGTSLQGELQIAARVAWSRPVSLRTVHRAAHSLDVTINDLVVASVAGAVRRHLEEQGEEAPDEMHAMVPFNLRSLDEPLDPALGNRFGLILLTLPTGVADRLDRVHEARRRMNEIKDSHEGPISYGIVAAMGLTPPAVEGRLLDFFSSKGSMVLTNVPGPREQVRLVGVPVRGILIWAPCSGNIGMSVSVFSYAGQITVGFLTDAGLVPDPQTLADGFRAELLALARAARQPS